MLNIAIVIALSDRGQPPPEMFIQPEHKKYYALSLQNRYDQKVQKKLHGKQ